MADPACILGIDPGKSGGVVAFYEGCHTPALLRAMPDTPRELFDCVQHSIGPARAYVEHVTTLQMSTGASPTGNFKLGWSLGVIEGVLAAAGIPYELVRATTWQKAMGYRREKGISQPEHKRRLKALALRLFPTERVTLATADALLIGEYGRRKAKEPA